MKFQAGRIEARRFLMFAALCAVLAWPAGAFAASEPASGPDAGRYNDLGNKMNCSCGCGQILLKCNHVGCPNSDGMIRELKAAVSNYSSDEDVLNWFRRQYGATIVIEPATHGFELTIWIVPPILVASVMFLLLLLLRRWRRSAQVAEAAQAAGAAALPQFESFRAQARRETEL